MSQYFEEDSLLELETDVDIDHKIIEERNVLIKTLSDDISMLHDLFVECANMVFGQGQDLETIENNISESLVYIEEGTKHLEQAATYQKSFKGKLFDVCIMAGGIGLGALGFIGGPLIGIPTIAAGLGLSGGVVLVRNKLEKS